MFSERNRTWKGEIDWLKLSDLKVYWDIRISIGAKTHLTMEWNSELQERAGVQRGDVTQPLAWEE